MYKHLFMNIITAEIITIGDEILFGQITDTNSQWMANQLTELGIVVRKITSISDQKEDIISTVENSLKNFNIVLLTGGLGPTKDDVTKNALAELTHDTLIINKQAEEHVKQFFVERGLPFSEINRQQAAIPSKCQYIHNETGTAPGMWFNVNKSILVSMPGVPFEMKHLMNTLILPKLKEHFQLPPIVHRFIKTAGIGESFLAEKIEKWEDNLPKNIKLAYLPSVSEVLLRLSGFGQNVEIELEKQVQEVLPIIDEYVYATENISLEEALGKLLLEENSTLSTAESCTGGNISHLITKISGSSAYFLGTVVSYANSAKLDILKVVPETLSKFGAVSEQTVIEMALGVQKLTGSTYAISTSGIAGPGGGTPEKPVGTIWMAVTNGQETITKKLSLKNDRLRNIEYTSKAALNLLRLQLSKKWQK